MIIIMLRGCHRVKEDIHVMIIKLRGYHKFKEGIHVIIIKLRECHKVKESMHTIIIKCIPVIQVQLISFLFSDKFVDPLIGNKLFSFSDLLVFSLSTTLGVRVEVPVCSPNNFSRGTLF